jgi:polyphenol oxidase
VSPAPYDDLNLALESDDPSANLAENHHRVLADFAPGDALRDLRQVHGTTVEVAEEGAYERPDADGIVTAATGLTLMVRVADCVPVLLADPDSGVIGAAHAGRLGLQHGVVPATLERMRSLGADRITAWLGPHICGGCYEVPGAMRAEVAAAVPAAHATTTWGTPSLDLGAGVRSQLTAAGVTVVDAARCTRESDDLYSHRRDRDGAGRLAGLIRREGAR